MGWEDHKRELEDLVETIKSAKEREFKERELKCTLLIGAGCSLSGGVPLAKGFIEEIQRRSPVTAKRAKEQTYPHLMAAITPDERRNLILKYIRKARLNKAHLAIAQLIKHDFVDRVLTTNFDPLVSRACTLANVPIAVYDFAASQRFDPTNVATPAIFHLHGQHTGFRLLNTPKECNALEEAIKPLFEDTGRGRIWIVVGYSGENDPVFNELARVECFNHSLYWVCFENSPPSHLCEKLLKDECYAYFLAGYNADTFFAELATKLGCFPPDFMRRPFTHLKAVYSQAVSQDDDTAKKEMSEYWQGLEWIDQAIAQFERGAEGKALELEALRATKEEAELEKQQPASSETSPAVRRQLAWAQINQGAARYDEALGIKGAESISLLEQATLHFQRALDIDSQMDSALYNLGLALQEHAQRTSGEEADRLWRQAYEKYAAALQIKPDKHEAFYNWGIALYDQSRRKMGEEADRLLEQACDKYAAALKVKPDMHEAFFNWGIALYQQAKRRTGEEADRLWEQACDKFAAALKSKPDDHEAFDNWGNALIWQAQRKTGEEAQRLFKAAEEKCLEAERLDPGFGAYNLACGAALRGDERECERWLEHSLSKAKIPNRAHLESDTDLASVRDRPWFQAFLQRLPPDN